MLIDEWYGAYKGNVQCLYLCEWYIVVYVWYLESGIFFFSRGKEMYIVIVATTFYRVFCFLNFNILLMTVFKMAKLDSIRFNVVMQEFLLETVYQSAGLLMLAYLGFQLYFSYSLMVYVCVFVQIFSTWNIWPCSAYSWTGVREKRD